MLILSLCASSPVFSCLGLKLPSPPSPSSTPVSDKSALEDKEWAERCVERVIRSLCCCSSLLVWDIIISSVIMCTHVAVNWVLLGVCRDIRTSVKNVMLIYIRIPLRSCSCTKRFGTFEIDANWPYIWIIFLCNLASKWLFCRTYFSMIIPLPFNLVHYET